MLKYVLKYVAEIGEDDTKIVSEILTRQVVRDLPGQWLRIAHQLNTYNKKSPLPKRQRALKNRRQIYCYSPRLLTCFSSVLL